jgi:transcriptional regulator with XRE-family HTH domain
MKELDHTLEKIGGRLSELRIKKGFNSIKEFAEEYKLPLIQYWRMEKGKANITLKSLKKLLTIHDLEVEEFFCMMREAN